LTYRVIEEDGFNINAKVRILLSSDTADGDGNASSDILKRIKQQMSNPQLLINKRFYDLQ